MAGRFSRHLVHKRGSLIASWHEGESAESFSPYVFKCCNLEAQDSHSFDVLLNMPVYLNFNLALYFPSLILG